MTVPVHARFPRRDWTVVDVEKWNARLEAILQDRLGTTTPPPVDWAAEERRVQQEWNAEKAAVLVSRLDPRYRDAVPRHDTTRRWLAAYDAGRMVNLVIVGPTGVGKTWEAAAIARELLVERRVPVVMEAVPSMLEALRPNEDGASDIGQFQSAPVLIMDDFGAEKQTPWASEQLYRVMNFRHNRNLPTIVTANAPIHVLEDRYDDRLLRRMFEGAALLEISEAPPQVPTRFGADL